MRESDLVNELIRGMWPVVKLYRTNAGTFKSMDGKHIVHGLPRGFSDLFGVIPADKVADGRPMPVFLEAKIYPNKASPEQIAFLQEYRRSRRRRRGGLQSGRRVEVDRSDFEEGEVKQWQKEGCSQRP